MSEWIAYYIQNLLLQIYQGNWSKWFPCTWMSWESHLMDISLTKHSTQNGWDGYLLSMLQMQLSMINTLMTLSNFTRATLNSTQCFSVAKWKGIFSLLKEPLRSSRHLLQRICEYVFSKLVRIKKETEQACMWKWYEVALTITKTCTSRITSQKQEQYSLKIQLLLSKYTLEFWGNFLSFS